MQWWGFLQQMWLQQVQQVQQIQVMGFKWSSEDDEQIVQQNQMKALEAWLRPWLLVDSEGPLTTVLDQLEECAGQQVRLHCVLVFFPSSQQGCQDCHILTRAGCLHMECWKTGMH